MEQKLYNLFRQALFVVLKRTLNIVKVIRCINLTIVSKCTSIPVTIVWIDNKTSECGKVDTSNVRICAADVFISSLPASFLL